MSSLPSGTVTFLFTDIEGSTKLAQEHPDQWEALRAQHHAILQSAVEAQGGYVFQIIGDAFCVAFHTAGDALKAALQAQYDLYTEDWWDTPVRVRMGIHTGKADIQDSGQYTGYLALSRVQRLMSAGHGGQILISLAAQDLMRDDLPDNVSLRDLGEHRLKDLVHAERFYQVMTPGLPDDFPPLKTLDVELNNLPVQATHFIGREREIAAVMGLLRNSGVRLVTLTGAGGTGKTRLSLQVAAELLDEYEQGVWFVDLSTITDPQLLLPAIASALKVKESPGKWIGEALKDHLRSRNLLLVLDNFEQIVSTAPAISDLLNVAPKIKVLVSSREVLRLRGEHDYPVPPLGLPESSRKQTAAVLAQYEAVALFVQHARAANPVFELTEGNAASVAGICRGLDGLPLAIELAAARSRLLKPEVMLEKLKSRLQVLTGGARDLPHRQQTIRGTIDWSYDLLDPDEKVLFARLGVFVGGWTIESAEAVCGAGFAIDVLNGLESLLDKSLLRQFDGASGEARFSMLETIREYALEKLAQGGELPAIEQAHAGYMDQFIQNVQAAQDGPEEVTWFARLDDEIDNLRAAIQWTLAHQNPLLTFRTGRLYEYWMQRTIYSEPLGWLERGLPMRNGGTPIDRARAMVGAGNLLVDIDNYPPAARYYESALALFQEEQEDSGIATCLNNLGNLAWKGKDFDKARQLFEQSLVDGQVPGSFNHALSLNNLGSLAVIRGDYQAALDYYQHAREICIKLGAEAGVSYADWFLMRLALAQRKLDEALAHFQEYQKASWQKANPLVWRWGQGYLGYLQLLLGNQKDAQRIINDSLDAAYEYLEQHTSFPDGWLVLDGKARLELSDGRVERAAQLFGAAWTMRYNDDCLITEAERPDYEARIAEARSAIGDAAFDAAFKKGQAMTLKDAIAFATQAE